MATRSLDPNATIDWNNVDIVPPILCTDMHEDPVLSEISDHPCESCGGEMTIGDEIAAGICDYCYWEAVK